MNDGATKAHFLSGLWGGVEGVVVAIQAVEQSSLVCGLLLQDNIGLLILGRREVDSRRALGTVPVTLGNVERAAYDSAVDIAAGCLDEIRLCFDNATGAALVVDTKDLCADLKVLALGGCGETLEELHLALAIDDAAGVEFGDTGDLDGLLSGVEVDYFILLALESCVMLSA